MEKHYVDSSAFEKSQKYKRNKAKRHEEKQYKQLKRDIYMTTGIIVTLVFLLVVSVVVAGGLAIQNRALTYELTLKTDNYRMVDHYEQQSQNDTSNGANEADNVFVLSLEINQGMEDFTTTFGTNVFSVDPHTLTKSKLKSFIEEVQEYLNQSEENSDYYELLLNKYNESVTALENEDYLYPYSDKDYILLCNLVQREQGDNRSADEAQCLVACVPLNRQKYGTIYAYSAKDPKNPTLLEVLTQKNQYGPGYSYNMNLNGVTEKVQENVRKVFEHEFECPDNVLFQTLVYYSPEKKTMYTKIWNPAPYNYYTYFYYGKTE